MLVTVAVGPWRDADGVNITGGHGGAGGASWDWVADCGEDIIVGC